LDKEYQWLDKDQETKIIKTEVKTSEDKISMDNNNSKPEEEIKFLKLNKPDLNKNKIPNLPFKV
jgi:hypothetical protein